MTLPFFLISCGPKSQGDRIKEFVNEMNNFKNSSTYLSENGMSLVEVQLI